MLGEVYSFSKNELAMFNQIVDVINTLNDTKKRILIKLFSSTFDEDIGITELEICPIAILSYFQELGFNKLNDVSINMVLNSLFWNEGYAVSGLKILDELLKNTDSKFRKNNYTIAHKYILNVKKYKHINKNYGSIYNPPKKRKQSSIPGSKEDIEEIGDETKIEGKQVPMVLWGIPFALIIFTIFIGFKIYQGKKGRGK